MGFFDDVKEEFNKGREAVGPDDVDESTLDCEPQGKSVTEKRAGKIVDILDDDEVIHYIATEAGGGIDVEGSKAGHSLLGDDRSRKQGTTGYVRTVATNKRVAIKIPQFTGNDERSVPYDSITSVDLDTGLVRKRLTLQTPGQTYHIGAGSTEKDELREMAKFIRQKISETKQPSTPQAEPAEQESPVDQLEKLSDLHEKGVLTDDEFQDKKEELLDKI